MLSIGLFISTVLLPAVNDTDFLREKSRCEFWLPKVEGWCPKDKAIKMMDLIYQTQPKTCVEIGVFGGSSILPTALALKFNDNGVVYAIDPWQHVDCLKGYSPDDPNYIWWKSVNLEKIYQGFLKMVREKGLSNFVKVIRSTSKDALSTFEDESIDVLHIDGNHTEEFSLSDASLYFPKVKKGGYIWFDDINWSSTLVALEFLYENSEYIEEYSSDSYALFRK